MEVGARVRGINSHTSRGEGTVVASRERSREATVRFDNWYGGHSGAGRDIPLSDRERYQKQHWNYDWDHEGRLFEVIPQYDDLDNPPPAD